MITLGNSVATNTQNYSFSIWVLVTDWSYKLGEEKVIYTRTDGSQVGPEVAMGATDNTLTVSVSYAGGTQTCSVNQVPIQTWTNIIIVQNGKALDVYLDGKLTRTCVLPDPASLSSSNANLFVCPQTSSATGNGEDGFAGYTSSFRYFPYPLNPREAYKIYREGYAGVNVGFWNKYRLKFAFLKDNQEMASFEL
jgi:hypothetical protein